MSGSEETPAEHKVFAGNLAFATTQEALAEHFSVAGTVKSTSIITRGTRSLGYGFVGFDTEAEAKRAVELLHKKELDGRELNVEVAQPRADDGGEPRPARRRRRRAPKAGGDDSGGEAAEDGGAGGRRPRRPRKPRATNQNRENSKTTLFVANLPFSTTDEELSEAFAGLNVKSAHVVVKRNGRSKGFGFVEFNSENDQLAALDKLNGKQLGDRTITVSVALAHQTPPENGVGDDE